MLKTAAIVAILSTSAQAEDDRRLPDKMGFQYPKWLSAMNDGSLERPRQMQVDRADLSKEQQQALDDIVSIHIQTACRSTAKMLYRRYDHTDEARYRLYKRCGSPTCEGSTYDARVADRMLNSGKRWVANEAGWEGAVCYDVVDENRYVPTFPFEVYATPTGIRTIGGLGGFNGHFQQRTDSMTWDQAFAFINTYRQELQEQVDNAKIQIQ